MSNRPIKKLFKGGKNDRLAAKGGKISKNGKGKTIVMAPKSGRDQKRDGKGKRLLGRKDKFDKKGDRKKLTLKKKTSDGGKKDKSQTKEDLDKEMESYWLKGGNRELVTKRLDDDLDDYFRKNGEGGAKEETKVEPADAAKNPESAAPKA